MVYRYSLIRPLADTGLRMLMVLLNPSTADEDQNDPTIRRCIGFARREGISTLVICNAFGLRSTDPAGLKRIDDPIGPSNVRTIMQHARHSHRVVIAWGVHAGPHGVMLAKRLLAKHPDYLEQVSQWIERDPLAARRAEVLAYRAAHGSGKLTASTP